MPDPDARAIATYDAMAEDYETGDKPYNALYERPAIKAMLGDPAGRRVLDVGCGSGPLAAWLADRGADVVGFDGSAEMVRLARERDIDRAEFHHADLRRRLDFLDDDSFDLAVASLVLHYLRDWVPPLRELSRVLRPGARLVVSTHHPANDIALSVTGNYFDTELLTDRWTFSGKEFTVRFWRRPLSAMFAAFEQAGLRVMSFEEPQPLPECRERFPEAWEALTTKPAFAFFTLAPTAASPARNIASVP
jgi:SAM-dependent methyltransferase